ncbi:DNA repair protein rad50 [Elasticomyces elasticus]|uniref:DNA repair protein rad50 n=1 Tax=Exophiala sideris TaxID=1016849 RepID=A0ABR0IYD0_9EURO|nr:DNA repair protein rad50 [Elasticomyces elasticus]KAK5022561.1 DNA repair protein rad50 [Exophiala sideris]KAK5028089.1 DNA repair protein rad50 [Exophiala sideris]KAK5051830.1 DNA repair protein rad50 [Exophiala sideris]KAK5177838.1 DNA repair protein rad50 [Eurotiomycetes sp. CCFEE 6388]
MSRLHSMQISGIRSFRPEKTENIKFETPLTLIVGQNGSGKTSIIECLRYAFTGEQPPNTRVGGAFVHDPKLDNNKNVLALVRVGFRGANGAALIVTRRLELQVKKASRSLKTLECSLHVTKHGEKTVISSRVAELDLIMPKYLGVGTAIIDNVIFCHQDESLWPLSDPTTLKKKFDEIFEAQKYTKAIDNIKQIRKKHNEELGKYKIFEQQAKGDKDRAIKVQKGAQKLHDEVESLRAEVEDLERRISHARKLADEAWRKGEDYAKVLGTLQGKRIEAQGIHNTIEGLKQNLEEVTESDEWLQTTLEQFQTRQQELKDEMRVKQEEYLDYQDQIKQLGRQREEKVKLKGKYEQEKEEHERQLVRRKDMVREVAARHQIRRFDDLSDENRVEEFLLKIKKLLKEQRDALDRAKLEHTTQRREAQTLVNKLTERKAALQDTKITIRKQIDSNDREAGDFQRRVNQIDVDEGSRAVIESRIDDLNAKLRQARQAAEAADWDNKLQSSHMELQSYESVSSKLNDEIVHSTQKAGELARLSHLKQELKERQRSLETLLKAHSDRINKIVNQEWTPSTVEKVYQTTLNNADNAAREAERKRDHVGRDLEQVQFKRETLRKDLGRKKSEAQDCDKQIRTVVPDGPESYEEALQQAESDADYAREESGGFAGLHDYYQKVLEAIRGEKPACRTCARAFKGHNDPALTRMKKRMEDLVEKTRADAERTNPKEVEADYKRLLDLGLTVETWKKLVNIDIPTNEQELARLDEQVEALESKIEEHDTTVEACKEAKRDVESIGRTIASIAKYHGEIKTFDTQVEELSAKQSQQTGGRTLEDIREELNSNAERIRGVQNVISRLRTEQEQSRTALSSMELESRDLKGELNTVGYQLEKKASLAARVEEYRAQNQKQREALEKLDGDIEKLDPEIATAKARYEDVDQRAAAKEQELSHEQSSLSESVNGLNILNEHVRSFIDRDGPNQLARVNRELSHLEKELDRVQTEQGRLTRDMNKINDQIRDSEATRRRYSDNLQYRRETRALIQLQEEIEELASQNAEADRDNFQKASEKHTHEYNRLGAQQAGKLGEMKSKDAQLQEVLREYETDLKDAPQRYKEAHIKVEATKAAVEDLGRYGGALDKAIMKYHSLKMGEINSIIEELWRKTYKGTDVDSIMIRADNETGRGNRSYNYRVVMVKRDAEMDMRGRCSAGQKVLASIIIRLALAECFSANCGLIALDEPTTNLDRENIQSLALALKDIIEYRQQQSNFQLIVITHDEDFLRSMDCARFANVYYRVSRDPAENSIIEQQQITEVM